MILLPKYNMLIMLACMKFPRVLMWLFLKIKMGCICCVCVLVTLSCPTL